MNASLSWIKAYTPHLNVTMDEFIDKMTLSGTKVEGAEILDKDIDSIVVGCILEINQHPDADKLTVCQVDIGSETIQIVTGATNVSVGDKVPVVLVGGKVAGSKEGQKVDGGISIKKGKLRGVESFGMFCSIEEFGSSTDMYPEAAENGIYQFPKNTAVGEDAITLLGFRDMVFEFEVTSNRVDCYSVIGIAREVAATFDTAFVMPELNETGNDDDVNDYVSVTVEDRDLCPRFCARVIKNVKIGPSPLWLQRRLSNMGIRPINNIVDVTNFVMEEFGQPMHAYDQSTIAGNHIVVKCAKDGETFTTLDGQVRPLDAHVLMIADNDKYIGIAGIMGGENTMITDQATTVVLECATFDGVSIRKSSKRVGLRTDASTKFEKGLEPTTALQAIQRACSLIEEMDAGEVIGGIIDVRGELPYRRRISFQPEKINRLLGIDINKEEMLSYLTRLDFLYDEATGEIEVPLFRQDVVRWEDLAEEVARFYGYDNIPVTLPTGEATTGRISHKLQVEQIARTVAEHAGFNEGMSYSFESPKVFDKLLLAEDSKLRQVVTIMNPLGEDFSIMRSSTLHGMLTSLATNYNRRNKNVRLYELSNIYIPKALPVVEQPEERMQFTLGMYGEGDFYTMKGVMEQFLEKVGMFGKVSYQPKAELSYLHPGRQALVLYDNKVIGYLGEVHPLVQKGYDIGETTYIAVLDLPTILPYATNNRKYVGVPKYPAVTRDISMTISKEVMVGEIEAVIDASGGKYLESISLFDVYEGAQIGEGLKSVAYALSFRAADKTLEEAEIKAIMDKITKKLAEIGAELRG